jgi:hypothetical protein
MSILFLTAVLVLSQADAKSKQTPSTPDSLPTLPAPAPSDGQKPSESRANGKTDAEKAAGPANQENGSSGPDLSRNIFTPRRESGGFFWRLYSNYYNDFFPKKDSEEQPSETPPRRALPAPLPSPPLPSGEWQGSPLVGVPYDTTNYPLMKAIYDANTPFTDWIKDGRIKAYGWVNASGNWSTAKNSNTPDSYWIVPNQIETDQFIFRLERQVDSVQTDHIDWGFRATALYGIDYRYMTAGGWYSEQLLKHNELYGWDTPEMYFDVYFPGVAEGMIIRTGRWIATPDIEAQFAPDNYMGSHSLLFTFDTYTQTGVMATIMLNKQWTVQMAINAGNDMAPWYKGAIPCGMFGVRWVSESNNDSIYAVLNQINDGNFRHFFQYDQDLGHDNFNYPVVTWQHKFSDVVLTKQEAYFMWQYGAELGGTPSAGPLKPFGGGGGDGTLLPGVSYAYGTVNYTVFTLSKTDFLTVRNEWWKDERGMRSGFPGNYTSHAIGWTHNFNEVLQMRPEIGYYRNWNEPAFDLGTKQGIWIAGLDATLRF